MSDTHQAAQALWAQLAVNRPGITYADRVDTIALAIHEAEQRGEQRGMERAAGIIENVDEEGLCNHGQLAQAIRAAKDGI